MPGDGRKFTELYNVQHLSSNTDRPASRVTISTIQRLYSMLRGERSSTRELDEHSAVRGSPREARSRSSTTRRFRPRPSTSSSSTSATARSTALWRQVLDYFDAFLDRAHGDAEQASIRLLRPEPGDGVHHEQAVADGSTSTSTSTGSAPRSPSKGDRSRRALVTEFRDRADARAPLGAARRGRHLRRRDLDRAVVAEDQIRTVIRDLPRPALHRDLPRPHRRAEDADLRQGRLARRRHRPDRPRGVRQGQRLRRQDHLQDDRPEARRPARRLPQLLQPAHRGDGGHDRHRHRRQAAGVRLLHARGQEPHLLRADEGPRRAGDRPGRPSSTVTPDAPPRIAS